MQRKDSILSLQRKHDMTFFQCKENTTFLTARETTWRTFPSTEALHKGLHGGIQGESDDGRTTPMTWGASSYGKPPSGTNSLRSILDMAAAASGDERIPCSTHPKSQSNILSQKYLFQSTKNSKGCKACVAICLIFSTVEWTQPKEHPCNMKRASEQAWEWERDFYSANSTPIRRSFDHDISNSSHSLPTKHHKHPPSLQLSLLLTSNSTTQLHKDPLENLRQGKNRLQFNDLHQSSSSIRSISIISFHLFVLASLPLSLTPSLPPSPCDSFGNFYANFVFMVFLS